MVASSPNACLFIVTGVYKTRGEASGKGVLSVLWNGAWANVYTWTLLFFWVGCSSYAQAETLLTQYIVTRGKMCSPSDWSPQKLLTQSFPPFH